MSAQQTLLLVILQNVILLGITFGIFWAAVFVLRRILGRPLAYSLGALGFSRPRSGVLLGIAIGVAVGVGAIAASIPINLISTFTLQSFGYSVDSNVQEPLMQGLTTFIAENPLLGILGAFGVVVIFGPAVEEIVFRGGIFGGLYWLGSRLGARFGNSKTGRSIAEKTAFVLAALLSSVVFALLHLEPVILPALFLLAVGLCYLYRATGSILPPIVAHSVFNSFAMLIVTLTAFEVIPTAI